MQIDQVRAAVVAALKEVPDPELGESISDLGLVGSVTVSEACVEVVLIPTSATCPMGDALQEDVTRAVAAVLPGGMRPRVVLDFDTPWNPSRMSPTLQERFGWYEVDGA